MLAGLLSREGCAGDWKGARGRVAAWFLNLQVLRTPGQPALGWDAAFDCPH